MKRSVLIFALFSIMITARAQKTPEQAEKDKKKKLELMFSLVGIVHHSSTPGGNSDYGSSDSKGKIGSGGGVQINVLDFSDKLSLRGGIEFSAQGSKYEEGGAGEPPYNYGGGSGKLSLNYLNFPVTCRYQSKGGIFAEAGLQPGLLLSAKDKFEGETTDVKDYTNKFDMGVIVGGGYQVNKHIGIGLRVIPGLTNINKKQSTYEAPKNHNMVISLRGAYTL